MELLRIKPLMPQPTLFILNRNDNKIVWLPNAALLKSEALRAGRSFKTALTTKEQMQSANDAAIKLRVLIEQVEHSEKTVCQPLNDAAANVHNEAQDFCAELQHVEDKLLALIEEYQNPKPPEPQDEPPVDFGEMKPLPPKAANKQKKKGVA